MLLALHPCLVALHIEVRAPRARVVQAALGADVHHIIFSMLPAVHRSLALHIEVRVLRARVM